MLGYKKIALILISSILLCGCTNEIDQTEGTPGLYISDNAVVQTGDGQASAYAYSDMTVIDASDGGSLVYRGEGGETIVGAAGSSDMLFVLTYCDSLSGSIISDDGNYVVSGDAAVGDDQTGHMPFTLIAVNKNGSALETAIWESGFIMAGAELVITDPDKALLLGAGQEIDTFPAAIFGELLGYYQGKLYMVYHTYEEDGGASQRYAYCYEQQSDGSFVKSQDTLCMTIMDLYDQEYRFCGDAEDLFVGLNVYDRLLVWKQEASKVYAIAADGSILWEKQIDSRITGIKGTDGRLLLAVGRPADADGWYVDRWYYFIYDLESTFSDGSDVKEGTYAWSDGTCLDVRDGYLYFYRYNKPAYNQNQYYFYRCDLYDAEAKEELLFETVDIAGQPYQREGNNGVAGFTVQGDACYYMDFDGKSLWWFSCNLADDAHMLTRLDVVDEYHGIFDMCEITYATDSYRCGNCGELIYEYYVEGMQLYGDGDPAIDQINETLAEELDSTLTSMKERMEGYQTSGAVWDHLCDSYTARITLEEEVDGITKYRFDKDGQEEELICLEADYSGYDYSGGAHGYPWRLHFLFDLSDGSEIGMADVIGVSEEEFRALAAEYTVADYLGENGRLYFETDEDTLYETVYKYAGFDCEMYLGADGVVVEYFPYHLGPYGSGTIEVTVPYEELGLKLLEIYGVNE